MLKRQKALLYCFQKNGGRIGKIKLTKLFFLLRQEYGLKSHYDFAPYGYGPFSWVMYSDLRFLEKQGHITVKSNGMYSSVNEQTHRLGEEIDEDVKRKILDISENYQSRSGDILMKLVYKKYPYYAIKSRQYGKFFAEHNPANKVEMQKPKIFTIGYEGRSIDKYIDTLISNNVQVLVDIRSNPISMKYGFTYTTLENVCKSHGIEYRLIKELGVDSANRKDLSSYNSYVALFEKYRESLPDKVNYVYEVKKYLDIGRRVALTCFEEDHKYCHRCETSNFLYSLCDCKYDLTHL